MSKIISNARSVLDWTPHSECSNSDIVIDVLTPTVLKTHCKRCGGKTTALKQDYDQAQWHEIATSAQEHLHGKYAPNPTRSVE